MSWQIFHPNLRIRRMVANLAGGYADRALITTRLVVIQPPLSDREFTMLWAVGAKAMRKAMLGRDEAGTTLGEVACDFYDSCCQAFVTHLLGSTLILDLGLSSLFESIAPTLDSMEPVRLELANRAFMDLSANALKLASSTIEVLSTGLSPTEAAEANRYAVSYLAGRKDLNQIEKSKALEWTNRISWRVAAN